MLPLPGPGGVVGQGAADQGLLLASLGLAGWPIFRPVTDRNLFSKVCVPASAPLTGTNSLVQQIGSLD